MKLYIKYYQSVAIINRRFIHFRIILFFKKSISKKEIIFNPRITHKAFSACFLLDPIKR